ncbi:MAG: hypothetical protein ACRDIC_06005 [bacterium]
MTDRRIWGEMTKEAMEKRNGHVMELYAMGHDRQSIAHIVGLTPQRISQIVNGFGYGWGGDIRKWK